MAGSVAVGPATRAYREAGPFGTSGPGYATGTATRAARQGYAAPAAASPWSPPPIPPGLYNPIRDIEAAEGKRGSEQTVSGLQRQRTDAENQYGVNLAQLGQREGNEKLAHGTMLARLAEGYAKLAGRQTDQANASGTLYGGALISAAMKRAHNEGIAKTADEQAYKEQGEANEADRGKLSLNENELLGPGGSLTEALTNAGVNQQAFESSIGSLKGTEAAEHGYQAPTGAPYPLVNPVTGEHYRELKVGGKTIHEYHSGRKVTVR